MSKIERLLFYPVTISATVLALIAWTSQPGWFAVLCSLVVGMLWAGPLLPFEVGGRLVRVSLWFTFLAILTVILWGLAWTR